ncbi:hypothetical protein Tco_0311554 [Tanacetum coccineum]
MEWMTICLLMRLRFLTCDKKEGDDSDNGDLYIYELRLILRSKKECKWLVQSYKRQFDGCMDIKKQWVTRGIDADKEYDPSDVKFAKSIQRTGSKLRPYHFIYPERSLIMEEMLYKFIDEGKRKQEEMRAFICDFQTTNELLFKERNNSLIELRFGAQELLKVMNNARMIDYEVKGVTTCCPSYRILLVGSHFYRSNSLSLFKV